MRTAVPSLVVVPVLASVMAVVSVACNDAETTGAAPDGGIVEDAGPAAGPDTGPICPDGWVGDADDCAPPALATDCPAGTFAIPSGGCSTPWPCPDGWVREADGIGCLPPPLTACDPPAFAVPGRDDCVEPLECPAGWTRDGFGCAPPPRPECGPGELSAPTGCVSPPPCEGGRLDGFACRVEGSGCEVGTPCRPLSDAACDLDRFGAPVDPASPPVFVDAEAEGGGDGSREAPFRTLAEGLAAAGEARAIRLGPGTYEAPEEWPSATVEGACPGRVQLVQIRSAVPEGAALTLRSLTFEGRIWIRETASASLTDVEIRGADERSALVVRGAATAERLRIRGGRRAVVTTAPFSCIDCVIEGVIGFAMAVVGPGATVRLDDLVVLGIEEWTSPEQDTFGEGLVVDDGAEVVLTGCDIRGAPRYGIAVLTEGTVLEARGCRVADGALGGVAANGGTIRLHGAEVVGPTDHTVLSEGGTLTGSGWTLRGARKGAVAASAGGTLSVSGLDVEAIDAVTAIGASRIEVQAARIRAGVTASVGAEADVSISDAEIDVVEALAPARGSATVAAVEGGALALTNVLARSESGGVGVDAGRLSIRDARIEASIAVASANGDTTLERVGLAGFEGFEAVGGTVSLHDVHVAASTRPLRQRGGVLDAERLTVAGGAAGVIVGNGVEARIDGLAVRGTTGNGVLLAEFPADGTWPALEETGTLTLSRAHVEGIGRATDPVQMAEGGEPVVTASAILVQGGRLDARDLYLADTRGYGVGVLGQPTPSQATVARTTVRLAGARRPMEGSSLAGMGMAVFYGAELTVEDALVAETSARSPGVGARVGGRAILRRVEIRDGETVGVEARNDGEVVVEDVALVRNRYAGLWAATDSEITGDRAVVRETGRPERGEGAAGVLANGGGHVELAGLSLVGNEAGAVVIGGTARLADVEAGPHEAQDGEWQGLVVAQATVDVDRLVVRDAVTAAINVPGGALRGTDVHVRRVARGFNNIALCVDASRGADIVLDDARLEGCGQIALSAISSNAAARRLFVPGEVSFAVVSQSDSEVDLGGFRIEGTTQALAVEASSLRAADGWVKGNGVGLLRTGANLVSLLRVRFWENAVHETCEGECYDRVPTPPPLPPP